MWVYQPVADMPGQMLATSMFQKTLAPPSGINLWLFFAWPPRFGLCTHILVVKGDSGRLLWQGLEAFFPAQVSPLENFHSTTSVSPPWLISASSPQRYLGIRLSVCGLERVPGRMLGHWRLTLCLPSLRTAIQQIAALCCLLSTVWKQLL